MAVNAGTSCSGATSTPPTCASSGCTPPSLPGGGLGCHPERLHGRFLARPGRGVKGVAPRTQAPRDGRFGAVRRLSIARSVQVALLGLTLVLVAIAGLGVA